MKLNNFGKTVRLAVLGLGNRGYSQLGCLADMPDVEIASVCDLYADRIERAQQLVLEKKGVTPFGSSDPLACMDREDVDAVVIMTNWECHVSLAIQAMKLGKRPAIEVGGTSSLQECWDLVRTSESTGVPLMFLENCCFGEYELTMLNMIRKGLFGTVVHCAGGYNHDLRDEVGNGDINRHYRQAHFLHRNGELYPTHELGPIANQLNINRGNRMVSLVSMSSKAAGLHEWLVKNRPDSPLADAQVNEGDVVTTLIKCANGETIQLTHNCTLPCPYSRGGEIRGTHGMWKEDGHAIFIEGRTPVDPAYWDHRPESDAKYLDEFRHPLWREYREVGVRGGHDGMDYLTLRAFVESVQNQSEPPLDVYDAAAWMAVTPLSEMSIAAGSAPIPFPDFTDGRWCLNRVNPAREIFDNID